MPSNCVCMLLMLMLTLVKGGPENPRIEFWLVLVSVVILCCDSHLVGSEQMFWGSF